MASSDHDELVQAYLRVDPKITKCDRCDQKGRPGYSHLHGPSQPVGKANCRSHWICVEKYNGTVALRDPAGKALGLRNRPLDPINVNPLGYSCGKTFGGFNFGMTVGEIRQKWPSLDDFARETIAQVKNQTRW